MTGGDHPVGNEESRMNDLFLTIDFYAVVVCAKQHAHESSRILTHFQGWPPWGRRKRPTSWMISCFSINGNLFHPFFPGTGLPSIFRQASQRNTTWVAGFNFFGRH